MVPEDPTDVIARLVREARADPSRVRNEAATRLERIDEVLRGVLGWMVEQFHPEEYAGVDLVEEEERKAFIDYHLRTTGTIRLVVEAKREGKTFVLDKSKRPRRVRLRTLERNHGPELREVITQAKRYCTQTGTPVFAVTNGHQWVASVAFAPHVAAADISAIVFYDLEDIAQDLQSFVGLLSPHGVATQALLHQALGAEAFQPRFAARLNGALPPGVPPTKNYLARELSLIMRVCFSDLTDHAHAKMLKACYVASNTTSEDLKQLESFAGRMLPIDMAHLAEPLNRSAGAEARLADVGEGDGESVLLVGRAGSGKSTFLAEASRRLLSAKSVGASPLILHVDLKSRTEVHVEKFEHDVLVEDVCDVLLKEAETQRPDLNPFEHSLLSEIFAGELGRLKSSLSPGARDGDEYQRRADGLIQQHLQRKFYHLKAYLGFVARRGVRAVILLDNVDRGTEPFEKLVHQLAQMIAGNTRAIVVTSLRETTFQNGKKLGFLDVARHQVFAVSPPPLTEVARRRFAYVRDSLANDERLSKKLASVVDGKNARPVFDFADILSDAVLNDTSAVGICLQSLSGTNVRLAFEILEHFVASPYTDIERVFRRHQTEKRAAGIGLEDFLRSVMRRANVRYDEQSSVVRNLFQVPMAATTSHFIGIRALQYLGAKAGAGDYSGVRVADVIMELAGLAHSPIQVLNILNTLGLGGLVNSLSKAEPPWQDDDVVSISVSGRYYLSDLLWNREYLQNVVDDTIIYDESTFTTLQQIHGDRSREWPQRLDQKVFWFLIYLARSERVELQHLSRDPTRFSWLRPVAEDLGTQHFGVRFSETLGSGPNGRRLRSQSRDGRR